MLPRRSKLQRHTKLDACRIQSHSLGKNELFRFGRHALFPQKLNDMTLTDLQAILSERQLPANAYSLTGGLPNEAYCIQQVMHGKWQVYYSERGLQNGLKEFVTES